MASLQTPVLNVVLCAHRVARALAAGVSGMTQLEFVDLRNNRLSGQVVRVRHTMVQTESRL